ncbi:MAG: hypothetical protein ABIL45_03550 [candidate division WOR-3 bacterium]
MNINEIMNNTEIILYSFLLSLSIMRLLYNTNIGKKLKIPQIYDFLTITLPSKIPVLKEIISLLIKIFEILNYKKGKDIILKYTPIFFFAVENLKNEMQGKIKDKFEIFSQKLKEELEKEGIIFSDDLKNFAKNVVDSLHTSTKGIQQIIEVGKNSRIIDLNKSVEFAQKIFENLKDPVIISAINNFLFSIIKSLISILFPNKIKK